MLRIICLLVVVFSFASVGFRSPCLGQVVSHHSTRITQPTVGRESVVHTAALYSEAYSRQLDKTGLLNAIAIAKDQLSDGSFPSIVERGAEVERDWDAVGTYLRQTADQENRQGWIDYFDLQPLLDLLAENHSDEDLTERATAQRLLRLSSDAYWRMTRNQPGLEREPVVRLRRSVERLFDAAYFYDRSSSAKKMSALLDEMADIIKNANSPLTTEEAEQLSAILSTISASETGPAIVQQLVRNIGSPNVKISIGRNVIQRIVTRPVLDSGPNSDCILGTRVISQTHLDGQLSAHLLPSHSQAHIQLAIDAQFNSRGTGYNRGVKIMNRSYGPVRSVRDLFISDQGVSIGDVHSTANLQTQILDIQHPLRIVRKIAAKKAAQQRSAATRIAESRLENRVTQQFSEQSASQISQGNLLPRAAAQDVLVRLDLDQPLKHWSTSSDYLVLQMTVRNQGQITTLISPPSTIPGFDLVIQFHESAINNQALRLLAGRTLTDDDIRGFIMNLIPQASQTNGFSMAEFLSGETTIIEAGAEAIDEVSEEVVGQELGLEEIAEQNRPSLRIRFDDQKPIIFEARDGLLRIGLNVLGISRDGEQLRKPTGIWASFKPVRNPDGSVSLRRVDDVQVIVKTAEKGRFNYQENAIITRLRGRFRDIFPELLLSGPLGTNSEAIRKISPDPLNIKAIKPRDGWLTIYAE